MGYLEVSGWLWGRMGGGCGLFRGKWVAFKRDFSEKKQQLTNRIVQRAMERNMLNLKVQDKIPGSEIRKGTKIIDILEYTLKQNWKWAGHIARMKDNRWTRRGTEWQLRRGKRSR